MREKIQKLMYELSYILELLISCLIAVSVIILSVRLFVVALDTSLFGVGEEMLGDILGKAMTLAIGVEFIKMLCRHTPETVIEVLVFAIARQIVIEHMSALDTLIDVAAIAILFAVRKFLMTHWDMDKMERLSFKKLKDKLHISTADDESDNTNDKENN